MTEWGMKITFDNLPVPKQMLIDADINFFIAMLRHDIWNELEKVKNDRGMRGRMVAMLMKLAPSGQLSMDAVLTNLTLMNTYSTSLIKSETKHEGPKTTIILWFDSIYFSIWDGLKQKNPMVTMALRGKDLTTKKGIVTSFTNEIKKTYTSNFNIEELNK